MLPQLLNYMPGLREVFGLLTEQKASPLGHFLIHYTWRNRPGKRSAGLDGVDSDELIDRYADALDGAYGHLRKAGWDPPATNASSDAVPVYVFNIAGYLREGDPFTFTSHGKSAIFLRSMINEPTLLGMLSRAEADAVHEVTHVFTHRHRPPIDPLSGDPWFWFDEATAVLTERSHRGKTTETLTYGGYWAYQPEKALDEAAWPGGYVGAWFLEHLARNHGPDLIRDTWVAAKRFPGPIAAIDSLLRQKHRTNFQDAFEAYVKEGFHYQALAPDVHSRFGERSLTEWFVVESAKPVSLGVSDSLYPFAYRYYRFDVPDQARTFRVVMRILTMPPADRVRASLLICPNHWQLAAQVWNGLKRRECLPGGSEAVFEAELSFSPSPGAHIVLLVANVPEPEDNLGFDLTNIQDYHIEAHAN